MNKIMGTNRLLYVVGIAICVIVGYFALATAIDSANLWLYAVAIVLAVAIVRLLYLTVRRRS